MKPIIKNSILSLMAATVALQTWVATPTANAQTAVNPVNVAQKLVGQEYTYGAESLRQGFDTSGLLYYVYKETGYDIPRTLSSQYKMNVQYIDRISMIQPGDLLFFGYSKSQPTYAGIYIGNGKFIASNRGKDEVIKQDLTAYIQKYFIGARRLLPTASNSTPTAPTQQPTPTQPEPQPAPAPQPTQPTEQPVPQPTQPTEQPVPQPSTQPASSLTKLQQSIIATGEKYMGVPYEFGAKYGQTNTFDCSSFTKTVFAANGISLLRSSRQQATQGVSVSMSDLQVGDLMFFYLDKKGTVGHVGIYAGNNKILHTYGPGGVRYTDLSGKWWQDHYMFAKRVIQ